MTIYYNPAYSAAPYRNSGAHTEVGNIYCGNTQLLQRLLFYAGIPYLPASIEERIAHYHACMQTQIDDSSPFYKSFKIDSAGMSRTVLAWRDALVEVGWNMKSYAGSSVKLSVIRDIEPEDMPRGEADYWNMLIKIVAERNILPLAINIVVTCREVEVKPHIVYILSKLQQAGTSVEYQPVNNPTADGNLGKIQDALLNASKEKISLNANDDTFNYVQFANEDDALRYVATKEIDPSAVYYCAKPKRFDNTLRLLGKPTIGSSLMAGSPQVVQLFMLGNGLFEFPLNVNRIIEWLNMPISPIDGELRRVLCNALVDSGGINNSDWNKAKDDYLNNKTEEEQRKIAKQYDQFLPIPQSNIIDVAKVKVFNENLRAWASKRLAMINFPYEEIVKEQIATIESYCTTLLKMLESASNDFNFIKLQLWCKNIAQPGVYSQFNAETNSHTTISSMGDIHDTANSVVWFPAEDSGVVVYPFDMLNNTEYNEAESCGAMLYNREHHSLINQSAMLRILLNTKRLTIIEATKCNGEKVTRHPLVLQLNERIDGGLKSITQSRSISEEHLYTDHKVINLSDNPTRIQLDKQVKLIERYERETNDAKKAESYSSVSQLIQHPFTYVCERCAKIKDLEMPSTQDLNRTLGNVAHLIIEKVFGEKSFDDACKYYKAEYKTIFEEAVNEKGLLLRLPEHAISLSSLERKMWDALGRLAKIISDNDLSVYACEYDFSPAIWTEAGENVILGSRADMVLNDRYGGKVIFDFKYSNSKSRKTDIEENLALQLEVYRYMAKKEFGKQTPVRVAYVHLPNVIIFTADDFILPDEQSILVKNEERKDNDIMREAGNSYKLRWEQLKTGVIERVEGHPTSVSCEYAEQQISRGLFPLAGNSTNYGEDRFDKGYKNLK